MNKANTAPGKVIPFPRSEFDAVAEDWLTPEERAEATAALNAHYAEAAAREDAARTVRELTPEAFAARVAYMAALEQPTPNADGVRIGDLLYGTWGYEQTNVDFFEVVGLKGTHTAILRKIAGEYVGGFSMAGNVRPCRGKYIGDETYTVRTKTQDWYGKKRLWIRHPTATGHMLDRTDDDTEHAYTSYY